jgi:undecaprenyl diphosphate synthase
MSLLVNTIDKETKNLIKNNIRLSAIGDLNSLPSKVANNLNGAIAKTEGNTGLNLVLALSYSSRWEIVESVKNIAKEVKEGRVTIEEIDNDYFSKFLTTKNIPDPELLIRTSGETRISNFLLWQIAYSELYFTPTLWPDFRQEHLFEAIADYQCRERRFGKTSEQLSENLNANS